MHILDHDDRRIDHCTDGDGNAAEAHDVRAQPEHVHADVGHQHPERQRDDGNEGTSDMEQKHDADERDDDTLLDQRALECFDRAVDELRAVIDRFDAHALRQARRDLDQSLLYVTDY
jgi:hypothetical protein